jgi:hypothetical protein
MLKADALKFLAAHPDFQSAEDQAVIAESAEKREPKAPRVKKVKAVKAVKAAKKAKPTIDSIKARAKKQVTAEQIVAAALAAQPVAQPTELVAQ